MNAVPQDPNAPILEIPPAPDTLSNPQAQQPCPPNDAGPPPRPEASVMAPMGVPRTTSGTAMAVAVPSSATSRACPSSTA